jgi:hypothetical protein
MHDGDLTGRTTEADEAEFEPELKSFGERDVRADFIATITFLRGRSEFTKAVLGRSSVLEYGEAAFIPVCA